LPTPPPVEPSLTMLARLKHVFVPDLSTYDPSLKIDTSYLENCKPHHRQAIELAMKDLYGRRSEYIFRLPASWEGRIMGLLNDKRDLGIALVFLQCSIWLACSVTAQLYFLPRTLYSGRVWVAFLLHFAVTWALFGQRFILAMHYSAHRQLFSSKLGFTGKVLNNLPQTVLSNFWGMPCGAYYLHHIVMHHEANNLFPYDLSATTPYQRDSPLSFLHYTCNFALHTILYLPYYALQKNRWGLALFSVICTISYFSLVQMLYNYHPAVFFISFGFSSGFGPLMLMFGNFGQHMFVDPKDPTSNYGLTVNLIASPFNMQTFNDGYHIVHHLSARRHWSEMPLHFIKNIDKFESERSIIFKEINYEEMNMLVYTGQLRKLASKYLVQLRPDPLSVEEAVAMLRERLKPCSPEINGREVNSPLSSAHKGLFGAQQLMWLVMYMLGAPHALIPAACVPVFALATYALA